MLTDDELKAIEDRCNAATAGPWERSRNWSIIGPAHDWDYRSLPEYKGHALETAYKYSQQVCLVVGPGYANRAKEDHLFIAHSRTDIPALIAALREAWAEISRLRAINHYDMEIVKETRELNRQLKSFMSSLRPEDENSSTVSKEIT